MGNWQTFLPYEEVTIYKNAGFTQPVELGHRMALIIIDCTYAFIGSHPHQSLSEAMNDYSTACGPVGWEALPYISKLLQTCREHGMPVVYTRNDLVTQMATGMGATKGSSMRSLQTFEQQQRGNEIPDMIAPLENEWIIEKVRASTFHGTLLSDYLTKHSIDTLIVCGTTTSGCVRASVVDAFSNGLKVFVVDDCCFDRAPTPHLANLWDMNAKYATVVSTDEIVKEIKKNKKSVII